MEYKLLKRCEICPHKCGINRNETVGRCRANTNLKIANASLFYFEEPCISGKNGSGAVFFSNCNLRCVYCQNYQISAGTVGKEITEQKLAEIFLDLQLRGANNINLVTPTIYVLQIIEALKIAKSKGLNIPVIYNTNGYENIETLKMLDGYVDVYLPDLKYVDDKLSLKYSCVLDYFEKASVAIQYMYKQVGKVVLDENGIIQRGVIIRHLVLPNNIQNSMDVLKWIHDNFNSDIYLSLMAQYFPTYKAKNIDELNRKITKKEYNEVQDYLFSLELENGYIQELGEHEEEYVPDFSNNI